MDPFFELYCLACHNYWMYCDCVDSYVDVIPEDATSHEEEEGDDDDDDSDYEPPPASPMNYPFEADTPEKPPRPPIDEDEPDIEFDDDSFSPAPPPPKPPATRPNDAPPETIVLVDKPKPMAGEDSRPKPPTKPPNYMDDPSVIGKHPPGERTPDHRPNKKPDRKPTPPRPDRPSQGGKSPTDDSTVALRYFEPNSGRPFPFLTSPTISYVVDTLKMPIYTGPNEPLSPTFTKFLEEELWPWFDKLGPVNKQVYLEACFTSDPQDGVQQGNGPYYKVSIKYNHGAVSGEGGIPSNTEYVYTITPLDGSGPPQVVFSDYRIPPRAFNNKESIDKYFFYDAKYDGFIPRYKKSLSKSGRRDPWYDGDAIGSRMARKPHYDSSADVPPHIYDPTVPTVPPPPSIPPFHNAQGNSESLNGKGFFDNDDTAFQSPYFNYGYVSTNWYKSNHGNFRNYNSAIAFIRGVTTTPSSFLYCPVATTMPLSFYGNNLALSSENGFSMHMDLVNKNNPGRIMYCVAYIVCTTLENCPTFDVAAFQKRDTNIYQPNFYDAAIIDEHEDGSPRMALNQMTRVSTSTTFPGTNPRKSKTFPAMTKGTQFQFCVMVACRNDETWMNSSEGGNPFLDFRFACSGTINFRFDQVSSIWKENTRRTYYDPKTTLPEGVGYMATTYTDYTTYLNRPRYGIMHTLMNGIDFLDRAAVKTVAMYQDPDETRRKKIGGDFSIEIQDTILKGKRVYWYCPRTWAGPYDGTKLRLCSTSNQTDPLLNCKSARMALLDVQEQWANMPSGSVPPLPLDYP